MKKLFLAIGLTLGLAFASSAQWTTYTYTPTIVAAAATNAMLLPGTTNILIKSFTLNTGTNATAASGVGFYDNSWPSNQLTLAAYSNVVASVISTTNSFTSTSGQVVTNIETGYTFTTTAVAAAITTLSPLAILSANASGATTSTANGAWIVNRGLVVTSLPMGNIVTVVYRKAF